MIPNDFPIIRKSCQTPPSDFRNRPIEFAGFSESDLTRRRTCSSFVQGEAQEGAVSEVTYFVVQAFAPARRGRVVPGEAREARSAAEAVHLAERLGAAAGAVALARTCDPSVGSTGDA